MGKVILNNTPLPPSPATNVLDKKKSLHIFPGNNNAALTLRTVSHCDLALSLSRGKNKQTNKQTKPVNVKVLNQPMSRTH